MTRSVRISLAVAALLALVVPSAFAQSKSPAVQPETRLTKLLPASVFLDGENVPTQKRNSSLVELQNGKLLLAVLVDTAGYSSSYQEKYIGIVESQGAFTLGGKDFGPGAYGFGRKKSGEGEDAAISLCVYDLGGNQLAQLPMEKNANLRPVKPLQVVVDAGVARLYLGPYYLALAGK